MLMTIRSTVSTDVLKKCGISMKHGTVAKLAVGQTKKFEHVFICASNDSSNEYVDSLISLFSINTTFHGTTKKYQNFVAPKLVLEACKGMDHFKVSNVRLKDENKFSYTPVDFDVYSSSIPEQVPDHQVMFLS